MGQASGVEMTSILDVPRVRAGRGMQALCTDQHAIPGPDWQPRLPSYCLKTGQAVSSPGRIQTLALQK